MKNKKILTTTLIVLTQILFVTFHADAQYCGMPAEYTTITTSDGEKLEISYEAGNSWSSGSNSIDITGNGYSIDIRYSPGMSDWISLEITNNEDSWWTGEGVIKLSARYGWGEFNEIIDTSGLTPEYLELWTTFQEACGELLKNKDFWELFKDEDVEELEALKEKMELLRDGYIAPETQRQDLNVSFCVNPWNSDTRLARGYHVRGNMDLYMMTPSPVGSENPEVYLTMFQRYPDNDCVIHINPLESTCLAYWQTNSLDNADPMLQEEWEPFVERMIATLEFMLEQVPILIEYGMITEDDEYVTLIEESLEGLAGFPIEARIFAEE